MKPNRITLTGLALFGAGTIAAWPAHAACPAGTVQVGEQRIRESEYVIRASPICEPVDDNSTTNAMIRSMLSLAQRQRWSASELRRLEHALRHLPLAKETAGDQAAVSRVWATMRTRTGPSWSQAAATGNGPGLYGIGKQSFEDCTIFALAAATGRPYGWIAGIATDLIHQGEWHSPEDRRNPQTVIEQSGLNGGEVIIIAEALGRAEIVTPSEFASTIRSGRPVLVGVSGSGGGMHELVLSKTFVRDGAPWFEVIDSNKGPQQRLYLNAAELGTLLRENGVSYRPDRLKTVKPLRPSP